MINYLINNMLFAAFVKLNAKTRLFKLVFKSFLNSHELTVNKTSTAVINAYFNTFLHKKFNDENVVIHPKRVSVCVCVSVCECVCVCERVCVCV